MSLSKLGLPGSRCGIIIANEKIITAITNMNGIISLSPGGIGPAMMCEMIRRNDLLRLSNEVIKPFYSQRVQETIAILRRYLPEERCLIHKPEGAIFLLKWFTEFGHLNRGDMLTSEQHRCHNEKRNFSAEFKRESAQLVVDQNYTVADAASAMDVGLSTMTRWVKQLRDERQGKTPKASPLPRNKLKSVSSGKATTY